MMLLDLDLLDGDCKKKKFSRRASRVRTNTPVDDLQLCKTTLFVSTIPYSATNEDLLKFFSEIGPVKSCFVVKDSPAPNGEFRNKGYGLVSYSFREDALTALKVLKKRLFMNVRKLKISLALKKSSTALLERKESLSQRGQNSSVSDPTKGPTIIFLEGLESYSIGDLYNKLKDLGKIVTIQMPLAGSVNGTAKVVFGSVNLEKLMQNELVPKILRGKRIKEFTKDAKSREGNFDTTTLFIRNLPWSSNIGEVYQHFREYGQILECTIPLKDEGTPHGFGFIKLSRKEAELLLKKSSSEPIRLRSRVLNISLSGSQSQIESECTESKGEESVPGQHGEGGSTPSECKSSRSFFEGCTLFVRNLPYGIKDEQLRALFCHWGKLRYANINMDKSLNRSRGTGFVCYVKQEDCEKCLSDYDSALEEQKILGINTIRENTSMGPTSVVVPELSEGLTKSLLFTIDNRFLCLAKAVNKEEAKFIDQERIKTNKDSRNTYLLIEGVIFPNTPAAESISDKELDAIQKSYAERKAILKKNPSIFVSRTRLSVRNLPKMVDKTILKRAAIYGVRKFWEEVENMNRNGLEDDVIKDDLIHNSPLPSSKRVPKVIQAKIVYPKLLRSNPKSKSSAVSKRYGFVEFSRHSDALAFLRWGNNNPNVFQNHEKGKAHKGNPRRLVVEFALENKKILEKRQMRRIQVNGSSDKESTEKPGKGTSAKIPKRGKNPGVPKNKPGFNKPKRKRSQGTSTQRKILKKA